MRVILLTDKIEIVDINISDFVSKLDAVNERMISFLGNNFYLIYDDGIIEGKEHNAVASYLVYKSTNNFASYNGDCIIIKTTNNFWNYDENNVEDIDDETYNKVLKVIDEYNRSVTSS